MNSTSNPQASASPSPISNESSTLPSISTVITANTHNGHQISSDPSDRLDETIKTLENTTNSNNFIGSLTNSQISILSKEQPYGVENHLYNTPDLVIVSDNGGKKLTTTDNRNECILNSKQISNKPDPKADIIPNTIRSAAPSGKNLLSPKNGLFVNRKIQKRNQYHIPITIWLAVVQLILSVTLVALGILVIAREAALSATGAGIWSGGICAIAGALGVINVRKAQTGYLALSLICVASSTLAIALSGIGVVRDVNLGSTDGAIIAQSGLILTLSVHFFMSVLSVYYSAIRLCARVVSPTQRQMVENVIAANNSTFLNQKRVEEYIKSMSINDRSGAIIHPTLLQQKRNNLTKEVFDSANSREKLVSLWLGQGKPLPPLPSNAVLSTSVHGTTKRPMILLPAGIKTMPMLPSPTAAQSIYSQPSIIYQPPQMAYPPYMMPPPPQQQYKSSMIQYSADIQKQLNRIRTERRAMERQGKKREHHRNRQRRKSDSDADKAFMYTGLDRAIADSFLEQQQKIQGIDSSNLQEDENGNKYRDVIM